MHNLWIWSISQVHTRFTGHFSGACPRIGMPCSGMVRIIRGTLWQIKGYQGLSPHKKSVSSPPSAASFPTETGWHGQRRDSIAPEPWFFWPSLGWNQWNPPLGDAVHVLRIQHATDRWCPSWGTEHLQTVRWFGYSLMCIFGANIGIRMDDFMPFSELCHRLVTSLSPGSPLYSSLGVQISYPICYLPTLQRIWRGETTIRVSIGLGAGLSSPLLQDGPHNPHLHLRG